jgi:hypothetical protein
MSVIDFVRTIGSKKRPPDLHRLGGVCFGRPVPSLFLGAEEHVAWDTSSSPQDENATDCFILNRPGLLVYSSKDVDRSGPVNERYGQLTIGYNPGRAANLKTLHGVVGVQ